MKRMLNVQQKETGKKVLVMLFSIMVLIVLYICTMILIKQEKEEDNGAFWEVGLHVGISASMAYNFGIIGLMAGTFIAALVRTAQFVWYSYRKILHLPLKNVVKNYVVSLGTSIGMIALTSCLLTIECANYFDWILYALLIFGIVTITTLLINITFGYKNFINVYRYLFRRKKSEKKM